MGDDYDNFWDPYCPCRVTRKNIVMTILAILSFALVAWTVIITGQDSGLLKGAKSNVTYVYVDDSKGVGNINITMSSVKTLALQKAAQEKKVAAINTASEKAKESQKVKLKYITSPTDSNAILCQCLCNLNVTIDEVLTALEFMEANKDVTKIVTTTAAPIEEPSTNTNDPYEWN